MSKTHSVNISYHSQILQIRESPRSANLILHHFQSEVCVGIIVDTGKWLHLIISTALIYYYFLNINDIQLLHSIISTYTYLLLFLNSIDTFNSYILNTIVTFNSYILLTQ